jgi:hypothetical protein
MNEKFYYEGVECMKNLREKALEVHKNPLLVLKNRLLFQRE